MDNKDHINLKKSAISILICELMFIVISIALFLEKDGDNDMIFTIVSFTFLMLGFKSIYLLECMYENKRNNKEWNKKIEYIPFIFLGLFTIQSFIIFMIVLLHENGIGFIEAFLHLGLITSWQLLGIFVIWVIVIISSIHMALIHRNNSSIVYNLDHMTCTVNKNETQIY